MLTNIILYELDLLLFFEDLLGAKCASLIVACLNSWMVWETEVGRVRILAGICVFGSGPVKRERWWAERGLKRLFRPA